MYMPTLKVFRVMKKESVFWSERTFDQRMQFFLGIFFPRATNSQMKYCLNFCKLYVASKKSASSQLSLLRNTRRKWYEMLS